MCPRCGWLVKDARGRCARCSWPEDDLPDRAPYVRVPRGQLRCAMSDCPWVGPANLRSRGGRCPQHEKLWQVARKSREWRRWWWRRRNGQSPTPPARRRPPSRSRSSDYGEAPQIGLLGDTGTGKTTAAVKLLELYLVKSPGSVFVIDDKGMSPRYEGQYRRDRQDLQQNPIDYKLGRVTVFRGDAKKGLLVDVEEVAEVAWVRAGRGRKTLMLVDEMISGREELSKNNQWRRGVTWYPRGFTGGREPGVGDLWGAQSPQLIPIEPFEESGAF